jgi:ribosome-associated protein
MCTVLETGRCEIDTEELLKRIQELLDGKKAIDVEVIDVRKKSTLTDWVIVASGMSRPHVKALYEEVLVQLKHEGVPCYRHNGEVDGGWLVLDYFHVVLHLFTAEVREFYKLEDLWKERLAADREEAVPAAQHSDATDDEDESGTEQSDSKPKSKKKSSRPSSRKVFEGVSKRVREGASAKRGASRKSKS